ncbi:coproporphyrinogen III oxidase [Vagococcus penaei]|uniref:Heme chaperone HemW n=1 Tax=Vagococcus penaei TaxID=633807 RepID=A0A1Q2D3U0_9ENTE|nr:radical SAM family heme chaperone HemW [Vagococcus penaei]AQP53032.1 coproporphyrinogen III oxidase [Vagococcus penaei]RSU06105.1 coproporphyrinogen III oxidase [Vagococcus penaei]
MTKDNTLPTKELSAYIHIPFCEHICFYCDFNKVFIEGQPVDEYIQALIKETRLLREAHPASDTRTIYIGGGTPTSLSAKQLDVLLAGIRSELPFDEKNEFTVEANPGDLTLDKLRVLQNYGVNRLSMGVQTFDDRLLKKIGRKHTAQDVFDTMAIFEQADFRNVSIDLIYALPNQTMESFNDTLDKALALDLPHYSLYSLILENKTMFYNWARQGRLHLPGIDVEGDMFERAIERMTAAGKEQYEVSNFAQPGHESQHNLVYWNNEEYYGLGAGASGYLNGIRYKNHGPIQHYLEPLRQNSLPVITEEVLTLQNKMEEEMFLGLRKRQGVSMRHFEEKFQQSFNQIYGETVKRLLAEGLLNQDGDWLALSNQGLILGNNVFEQFLLSK